MGRFFGLLCALLFLSACSSTPQTSGSGDDDLVNGKDVRGFEHMISALSHNVNEIWGREALFAGKFDYVKYTDQYKSRAHIDFSSGHIMVETVSGLDPRAHLRRAIIETLLTPDDPAEVDLYSDREIMPGGEPFLYGQVLDNQGQAIRSSWRAERYADYLIANAMKPAFGADGVTIMQFNEPAGGQVVFHLHVHVIPRWEGVKLGPHTGVMAKPDVLAASAAKLKAALGGA